jgi:porin
MLVAQTGVEERAALSKALTSVVLPAALAVSATAASAEGSLWNQQSIFDTPGGLKESFAETGIGLDVWVTEFGQGILSGDGEKGIAWGGKGDVLATFDGGKLGLWQGFSVLVHHEVNWGEDANTRGDGSIVPVNTAMAFPRLGGEDHETSIVVTQALGERATISAGKFNMLDAASKTPILGGGGWDTFMNTALAAPISGVTPPYIAGVIASYRTDPAIFTLMVYDPRNAEDLEVIRTLFEEGVTTSLSVTVPTRIGGLQGFYGLRGVYSSAEGLDLASIPQLILPPGSQDIKDKDNYLFGSLAAQQYLWQNPDNPEVGWGLFGLISISDGNPNPIAWSALAGIGGTGGFYSEIDRWGIAYFHYEMSSELKDGLVDIGVGLEDESGIEAYYNLALAPWLRVSADLQWIDPATPGSENALIGALRTQIKF